MKIDARSTDKFLAARPSQPVVLIYGPDHGLVRERADTLARFIVSDLSDPFNVATLEGSQITEDPARFFDEACALSLMGGDRLVRIREATDGLTAHLKSYLKAPNPNCVVIVEAGELGLKSSLRSFSERDAQVACLPCYVQEGAALSRVIVQRIRAAGLAVDSDAAAFLSEAIGGDQQQVFSEVDKLLTYMGVDATGHGAGRVTLEDAVACCGAMGQGSLDDFIDSWATGQVRAAMGHLQRLQDEGVAAIALVRSLLSHLRRVLFVRLLMAQGDGADVAMGRLQPKIFFRREPSFRQQLSIWSPDRLSLVMGDLLQAEAQMKRSEGSEVTFSQTLLSWSQRAGKFARGAG